MISSLCVAASAYAMGGAMVGRPALHTVATARAQQLTMEADATKIFRRAEFWEPETCTYLDMVNVLGRWEKAADWAERTEFSVVEKARVENMAQGASVERHEYARRNGYVERVALLQNAPKLPFTNEVLAKSVGKTVEEMNAIPVDKVATNIVYDALAQSKSSLLPEKTVDQRRDAWVGPDGFNEGAFMSGMVKSRSTHRRRRAIPHHHS